MWTETTRRKYEREGQRYASDVTDAEWALIEPHMPAAKPLGRPREIELRAVLDAILYIARSAQRLGRRHMRLDQPPFSIGQIACVAPSLSLILASSGFGPHLVPR